MLNLQKKKHANFALYFLLNNLLLRVLAMKKEREAQEANRRQNQMVKTSLDAQKREAMKLQAEAALKKQQSTKIKEGKQETFGFPDSGAKVPPPRPRQRPQGSPVKEPLAMNFNAAKFEPSKPAPPDSSTKPFVADFGAANLNAAFEKTGTKEAKKPPPRPSAPSIKKDEDAEQKRKV